MLTLTQKKAGVCFSFFQLVVLTITVNLATPISSHALSMVLPGFSGVNGNYVIEVKSFKERKFEKIFRQQYDYSCGSAALASLLNFHYEIQIDEQKAFKEMFAVGNQKKIQKQGFSLLDMKKFVEKNGMRANGYRTTLDKLKQIGVPAITLVNNDGYKHFIIVKGVSDDDVLIGDPSIGTKVMSRKKFEEIWKDGILFIINSRIKIARQHFDEEWNLKARAPAHIALTLNPVSDFNLMLPASTDF